MDLITTVTYLEMVSYPKHLILTKPEKLNAEIKLMVEPTVDFYRYLYDTVGEKWTWIERRLLDCLLYTSPSPRDATLSRMPSSA